MGAKSLFTSKSAGKAPLRKAARKHTEIFRRKNTFSVKSLTETNGVSAQRVQETKSRDEGASS